MLFELAKQPALQDQLCQEIKAVLGDKVNPSWEDLQNIPLVRHCLKETLRLYPAIQMSIRAIHEDAIIDGYQIPAGVSGELHKHCGKLHSPIFTDNSAHSTKSDVYLASENYFEEPDKFIPERWSKDKESIHPFASLPFGFGQRGCYGNKLK